MPRFNTVTEVVDHLRPWATMMAARFCAPVYLVGSTVVNDDPYARDYDVRVCVTANQFKARYGISEEHWVETLWTPATHLLYWEDMAALTEEAVDILQVNLDFAVQPPISWTTEKISPRIRLDLLTKRFPGV